MTNTALEQQHLPTAEEIALARESGRTLSAHLQTRSSTQQIDILDEKGTTHAELTTQRCECGSDHDFIISCVNGSQILITRAIYLGTVISHIVSSS